MQIDFHDNYIFAVIIFMAVIWFARNFLELIHSLCEVLDKCSFCCGRECIGYNAHQICSTCTRQSLAIYSFMQPMIVCLIGIFNRNRAGDFDSTVHLCALKLNSSALVYKHDSTLNETSVLHLDASQSTCTEVDYVFVILPFACMVSVTTLLWVKLSSSGDLNQDTIWDEGVYSINDNNAVFFYDIGYCAEGFLMNLAFVNPTLVSPAFRTKMFHPVNPSLLNLVILVISPCRIYQRRQC